MTLNTSDEQELLLRVNRGEAAQTIAVALGGRVSPRTISRRMAEIKGGAYRAGAEASEGPTKIDLEVAPEDTVEVAPGTTLEAIDELILLINKEARNALRDGACGPLSTLLSRMISLSQYRLKATPIKRVDPGESLDMHAAKERGRAAFLHLFETLDRK